MLQCYWCLLVKLVLLCNNRIRNCCIWMVRVRDNPTVPSLTNLPEALVTGRAVLAVRGVLMACSIVSGLPDSVLGLTNPVMGRPDWVIGLGHITQLIFLWGYVNPDNPHLNYNICEDHGKDLNSCIAVNGKFRLNRTNSLFENARVV